MSDRADRRTAWHALWERKGQIGLESEGDTLLRLLATDGFDAGISRLSVEAWQGWVDRMVQLLALRPAHRVLDVGCGSGPLLFSLRRSMRQATARADTGSAPKASTPAGADPGSAPAGRDGMGLRVGVDYSAAMLQVAREHGSAHGLFAAEAARLPFQDGAFDRVVCNGVFMYFPDEVYARQAVEEMVRVVDRRAGRVLVMDIPDLAKREASEERRSAPSDRRPLSTDPALTHLYYRRDLFREIASDLGLAIQVRDQDIPGYGNAPFRFNILLQAGGRSRLGYRASAPAGQTRALPR